jgi:hypothetical protein
MRNPFILATVLGAVVALPAAGASRVVTVTTFDQAAATETQATQTPADDHSQHQAAPAEPQGTAQTAPGSMPGMQGMMQKHHQMMAEMAAADRTLEALVKEMNEAAGQARLDLMARVVTELALQRKAMHEHMGRMGMGMCGGIMQHK